MRDKMDAEHDELRKQYYSCPNDGVLFCYDTNSPVLDMYPPIHPYECPKCGFEIGLMDFSERAKVFGVEQIKADIANRKRKGD
jgi:transcription initiation factor IIE alpha subunit